MWEGERERERHVLRTRSMDLASLTLGNGQVVNHTCCTRTLPDYPAMHIRLSVYPNGWLQLCGGVTTYPLCHNSLSTI